VSPTTTLTGPFDTSELPRLGSDPVTVTVSRVVLPGRENEFEAWAGEVEETLAGFPGCLGAGLLRPGPAGGPYQIVFRFTDPVSLRRWEHSPERAALLAQLDDVIEDTRVQRTVGVDRWFEAPALLEPARPWWQRWVHDLAWIYPVSVGMSLLVSPRLVGMPPLAAIGAGTALSVGLIGFVVMPLRRRIRAKVPEVAHELHKVAPPVARPLLNRSRVR
jgi:antibiotic biosynthesis monooxygenase (ABM) superfamily enzyme